MLNSNKQNSSDNNLETTDKTIVGAINEVKNATPSISVVSKSTNGLCPQLPNETTTTKYLRQDGTWAEPVSQAGEVILPINPATTPTTNGAIWITT